MAGEENLIPMSERSKEEVREIAAKGGINSGESRRKKKAMRESLQILLDMSLKAGEECDIDKVESFKALEGKNITVEQAMLVKQIQKALKGDTTALTFLRDTSGQNPSAKIDLTGAIPVVISGENELSDE